MIASTYPRVADETDRAAAARTARAWAALGVTSFAAFAVLTWLVASRVTLPFDQPILDLARSWSALTPFWNFVSDAANFPMIGVGVGLVLWLLWKRQRREAVFVTILLALATAGSEIVKELVARPRPIKGPEVGVVYSYASGHVLEALTILGIIAILVWRSHVPRPIRIAVAVAVPLLVLLVGIARMALGEHYPSDVLGGALVGIGTLSIFAALTTSGGPTRQPAAQTRARTGS